MTPAPPEYVRLILIPHVLHTPAALFDTYSPADQELTRRLLRVLIGGGQGLNIATVHPGK